MYKNLSYSDKKKEVIVPKKRSKKLAELWGIITGDGYIAYYPASHRYLVEVAGDKILDKEFLEVKVINLFKELFNYSPSIQLRKHQQTMVVRILSKSIFMFFENNGFPVGKKEQIGIPNWIKENKKFFLSFLRGYIDTDGCFKIRNNNYPIISFGSKSELLIKEICEFLIKEDFSLNKYYKEERVDKRNGQTYVSYKVYLNGKNNCFLWIEKIGFSNSRHLKKIKKYKKSMGTLGFVLNKKIVGTKGTKVQIQKI